MGNDTGNTVIRQCLDWLHILDFVCSILDYRTPKLTCRAAIILLLEAQVSGRPDPESIVENLRTCQEMKSLTQLSSLSASQLSRKLSELPTWLLQYVFQVLNHRLFDLLRGTQAAHPLGKEFTPLSIIDSTSISLPDFHGKWAYCSRNSNGVKMHLRLSTEWPDLSVPSKVILTTEAVADSEVAVDLVTEKDTTYVMDRGYLNYAHFQKWREAGISFVVRLQARNKTQILSTRPTPTEDAHLLLDADVKMTLPQKPDQSVILRLVEFKDDRGRLYRLITSRWDVTAREIADIYRDRWGIGVSS